MIASSISLSLWLMFGVAGGSVHFVLLRWNAALYVAGKATAGIATHALRMTLTAVLLAVAAWHGATALLAATIGVFVARALALRVMTVAP